MFLVFNFDTFIIKNTFTINDAIIIIDDFRLFGLDKSSILILVSLIFLFSRGVSHKKYLNLKNLNPGPINARFFLDQFFM